MVFTRWSETVSHGPRDPVHRAPPGRVPQSNHRANDHSSSLSNTPGLNGATNGAARGSPRGLRQTRARPRVSLLSRQNSDASMETAGSLETEADLAMRPLSSSPTKRSTGVSWSYSDNTMTYPILQIPKKEKHIERKIIDGREQDAEVEVEVHQPLKCLFLFPGKDGP
ncbi:uncharacterized protein C8Q71DRAFT_281686 [Rhodofomes roseus]|uniref:Uncharacterized protein n=1 Tax=Rhodofomes roseus TaxID=34475 RepID=A0ABQ8K575_9APHY|nr:uncharacterized protein C8Q71DRAFT_281686 [Rhodofomes roseus]KAH9832098.1 hypothetical protein C8Q71DRAFT_281686 [Rhodofomes roseus]